MAKCNDEIGKMVNGNKEQVEDFRDNAVPIGSEGMANDFIDLLNENKALRTRNAVQTKSWWSLIGKGWKFVTQRAMGDLDLKFNMIKDGSVKPVNFTNFKITMQSLQSDYNKTVQGVANKVKEVFSVHEYDENGNKIGSEIKPLSETKEYILGAYTSLTMVYDVSMSKDQKKLYFRDKYVSDIYTPEKSMSKENIELSKEFREEHKISIEEDKELAFEKYAGKRLKNFIANRKTIKAAQLQEEQKFKNKTIKFIKENLTPEQISEIELSAKKDFQLEDDKTYKMKKRIQETALNKNYQEYLKYTMIPTLWNQIKNDSQILEVLENRKKYNDETFELNREAQAEIGNKVDYLNKYPHYLKIVVQDLEIGFKSKATHSPLGVDLSMFTHLKGSTHEILTDTKLSDYLYQTGMAKNINVAKAKKAMGKYNGAPDAFSRILTEMEIAQNDLNKRLIDKNEVVSEKELEHINMVVNTFNNNFGTLYNDLLIDSTKIRENIKFRNKKGVIEEGSVNQEIDNNIEIAIENTKSQILVSYQEGMYNSFFENDLIFKDVKMFLDGKNEYIETKRLYDFAKTINMSDDININKLSTLHIKNLVELKSNLNSTFFDRNRRFVGKIINEYTKEGDYVLTDQNGNKIGLNKERKVGFLFMEDFNINNPDAFADWIAQTLYIDANINSTYEFLKNDKIMIMPKPIADTLDDIKIKLTDAQQHWIVEGLTDLTTISKLGMLFNPIRVATYNSRNCVYDFYSTLSSQPQAIIQLGGEFKTLATNFFNKETTNRNDLDIFTEMVNYGLGKPVSDALTEYIRYAETFMGVSESELKKILGFSDKATTLNKEMKLDEMKQKLIKRLGLTPESIDSKGKLGKSISSLVVGSYYFTKGLKLYMKGATHLSQTREFFLRYAVYKSKIKEFTKLYEKNGKVEPHNWGFSDRRIIKNLLTDANEITGNSEAEILERKDLHNKAAIKFAQHSLIAYEDSSKFVDAASKYGIPFARFPEGAIKQHYNGMKNFVTEMGESVVNKDFIRGVSAMARATGQTANAVGIPILAWNMAMLALQGMRMTDIPEYYEDDGFFVIAPLLQLFGYDQALLIANSDGFSDMLGFIGLDDLNTNIQNVLVKNWYAMQDEELDGNIFNGVTDAILDSFDSPSEMFIQSPVNKIISMGNPLVKSFPELFTGNDYYPDGPVNVGHRYTVMENISRKLVGSVGLGNLYTLYETLLSTPRGMDFSEFWGFKSIGTKQDAWAQQRALAYDYAEEVLGKDLPSRTGYGDTVDYMRDDIFNKIKWGDYEDAIVAISDYIDYLGEQDLTNEEFEAAIKSLQVSLKNKFDVIPSDAISQKEMPEYIATLSQKEINDLVLAYEYQREILGPYYDWIFGN